MDNASSDGSADFVKQRFPSVRVIALPKNLGFGGGSNAGFRAAKNDIVVLLNSDMRVEPDFLQPLLDGFTMSASSPSPARSSSAIQQAARRNRPHASLVARRAPARAASRRPRNPGCISRASTRAADRPPSTAESSSNSAASIPCLQPFYLEDTDLGFMAWKRGWKVLYQPRSVVFHEHRGTIGKKFSPALHPARPEEKLRPVLLEEYSRVAADFSATSRSAWADAVVSAVMGDSPERTNLAGLWRALLQLPGALQARWRARQLAAV